VQDILCGLMSFLCGANNESAKGVHKANTRPRNTNTETRMALGSSCEASTVASTEQLGGNYDDAVHAFVKLDDGCEDALHAFIDEFWTLYTEDTRHLTKIDSLFPQSKSGRRRSDDFRMDTVPAKRKRDQVNCSGDVLTWTMEKVLETDPWAKSGRRRSDNFRMYTVPTKRKRDQVNCSGDVLTWTMEKVLETDPWGQGHRRCLNPHGESTHTPCRRRKGGKYQ